MSNFTKQFRFAALALAIVLSILSVTGCENPAGDDTSVIIGGYIYGIAPVVGETPVTRIENQMYTGTVTWDSSPPVDNMTVFTAYAQYIATITLTAKSGYTLQGVRANSFDIPGAIRVSNNANSGVITAVFPPPINLIIIAPVKGAMPSTTAEVSDGMGRFTVDEVSWYSSGWGGWPSDGTFFGGVEYSVTVTLTANNGYNFLDKEGNPIYDSVGSRGSVGSVTINGQNVKEVYNHAGSTLTLYYTFPVTSEKTAIKFEVHKQPTKLTYTHGERLDLNGLYVALTYDDGTMEYISSGYYFTMYNITTNFTEGIAVYSTYDGQPIKITYGNFTCSTSNLTVKEAIFTSIAELETYLRNTPTNTAATPYVVALNVDDISTLSRTIYNLYPVKYVYLDLSGSTFTSIRDFAFEHCRNLTGITIPNSVTSIGDWVFYSCTSLTSVIIPNSVTSIGSAFQDCTSLTNVTIPNSVTSIGSAFSSCTNLSSVTIPDSVTSFGQFAFSNCISLTAINVDANNNDYSSNQGVLYNKDKTTLIKYPAGKTETTFTIPDSVTIIESLAFYDGTTSLTSLNIPNSVTGDSWWTSHLNRGSSHTAITSSLTAINVDANNNYYSSNQGVLYNKDKTRLIRYPLGKTGSFTIPDSVFTISESAFQYCISLTSVTIPDSVRRIEYYAFLGCTSLTSVTFQGTITSFLEASTIGDLRDKYLAGGIGTYTRASGGDTWTKQ